MQKKQTAQSKYLDIHLKTSARPVQVCVRGRVCYSRREARKAKVKKLRKSKVMQLSRIIVWRNTKEIPLFKSFTGKVSL